MRKSLQKGELDHIHVQKTRAKQTCVDTGRTIPRGRHAISMQNDNYLIWLAIPAVDQLIERMSRFIREGDRDPSEYGEYDFGSWRDGTSRIKYAHRYSAPPSGECIGCGEEMRASSKRFDFVKPGGKGRVLALHRDCTDDYIAALDRVWEEEQLVAEFV